MGGAAADQRSTDSGRRGSDFLATRWVPPRRTGAAPPGRPAAKSSSPGKLAPGGTWPRWMSRRRADSSWRWSGSPGSGFNHVATARASTLAGRTGLDIANVRTFKRHARRRVKAAPDLTDNIALSRVVPCRATDGGRRANAAGSGARPGVSTALAGRLSARHRDRSGAASHAAI